MNAHLATSTSTVGKSPTLSPDRVDQAVEVPTLQQLAATAASSVSAFEEEIEVYVPIPPKKSVSVTALVVGRNKAEPNPVLDL